MPSAPRWLQQQSRPARRSLALTVALGELGGILLILQTGLLVRIADGVMFRGRGPSDLAPLLAGLLVVIVARAVATWGSRRAGAACASVVKRSLRAELGSSIRRIGPVELASMHAGEIATAAVDGVETLDRYYSKYFPQRAISTMLPFTILAVVIPFDWISGLALVLTAVFLPASMILIGEESHARNERLWGTLARLGGRFLDVLQGLATVRMFGAARREIEEIARASEDYRRATMSVLRIAFLSSFTLELISTVSIAIVAVLSGVRLLSGAMGFVPAYFILLIAPEYFLTLRLLGTYYHSRMEAVSAAEHVRGLLEAGAAGRAPARAAGTREAATIPGSACEVMLERVSFDYRTRAVLDGVSFSVAPGEHVTLMGPSGAGKSTLIGLLLGFLEPRDGRILVGGRELAAFPRREWLERIAWLPQHPTLFHGTIGDNIRLGRQAATEEQVREAAALAHVDEFTARMRDGLDTMVGERGQGLSAGQIQRVALARLFLRAPSLVLLDEPTAHLDPESERLVLDAILVLAEGRTMVLATHRPAPAEQAPRVLLVENGTVREQR
jgi:ATP-binding cassette subfamily C protein CydD